MVLIIEENYVIDENYVFDEIDVIDVCDVIDKNDVRRSAMHCLCCILRSDFTIYLTLYALV